MPDVAENQGGVWAPRNPGFPYSPLFGVIAAAQGFDWLVEKVKIVNAKEHVLRVIAEVISRRLKETGQPIRRRA